MLVEILLISDNMIVRTGLPYILTMAFQGKASEEILQTSEEGDLEEYIHDYLCSLIEEKGTSVFINWQNMVKEIAKIIK